ncbi:hypothetical protein NA57DRAFT_71657 [Rhizodiscina lignyota]|uniref:BTB domain-containing protein n=1 Tax=Rhizodiscina lignyota TaxID=1504668 RepID=A0A9P4MEJ6_9PEZI|nr:hypothetical protein NA57DRAFT_71657 [Rhizodiscina lignyota]
MEAVMNFQRPLFTLDNLELVTVKVGKDATPCVLHKALLCAASKFFENAFNGNFKEAHEREVKLEEVDFKTFAMFMNWLYYSTFSFGDECFPKDVKNKAASTLAFNKRFNYILDLSVFADRYDCPPLHTAALCAWQEAEISMLKSDATIETETIHRVFNELPNTSSLRQEFVKWAATSLVNKGLDNYPASCVVEMFKVLQEAFLDKKGVNDWPVYGRYRNLWVESLCEHHGHVSEQEAAECSVRKRAPYLGETERRLRALDEVFRSTIRSNQG